MCCYYRNSKILILIFLIACKLPQEYQKQSVGCREKKRLEAVRLFGVFHDFSCVAEQVTDILDPVLEIARMQKASAGDQGMHVGNHWTG